MSRLRSGVLLTMLAIAAGLLLLQGCSSGAGQAGVAAAGANDAGTIGSSGGRQAPDLTLNDLEGQPVHLAGIDGTVQLVDFWATWCAPCREEMPMLKELNALYKDQGLRILTISDEDPEVVRQFVGAHDIPFITLVENGDAAAKFGVLSLPTAFLIDREGKIAETFYGPKPRRELEGRIRELLELDL